MHTIQTHSGRIRRTAGEENSVLQRVSRNEPLANRVRSPPFHLFKLQFIRSNYLGGNRRASYVNDVNRAPRSARTRWSAAIMSLAVTESRARCAGFASFLPCLILIWVYRRTIGLPEAEFSRGKMYMAIIQMCHSPCKCTQLLYGPP